MVRKFWLENAKGEKYDMTNTETNHFFYSPKNLGFVKDYGYTRLGNADVINRQAYQLLVVQGEMVFLGNTGEAYEEYNNFMNFIRFAPLKLHYIPSNTFIDYYANVIIVQLDKSEVNPNSRTMRCPVFFKCNTHWLTSTENSVAVGNEAVGEGKEYPLTRPYKYSGSSLSSIIVNNNGSDEVGYMFEVVGSVTNPQLSVSQNGTRYGITKINGTYDYIKINSVDAEEEIYLENGGSVIANPSSYQDFSVANGDEYVTFVKMRTGQNVFNFSYSGEFNGIVVIHWHDSYVSV